jgi:hypothetical protein
MSTTVTAAADRPTDGLASQIAYLARVLKTPTIAGSTSAATSGWMSRGQK